MAKIFLDTDLAMHVVGLSPDNKWVAFSLEAPVGNPEPFIGMDLDPETAITLGSELIALAWEAKEND